MLVATPELDKLKQVQEVSQKIGEFIVWLNSDKKIVLATWHKEVDECDETQPDEGVNVLWPEPMGDAAIDKLLAEYFHIDLNKVEQEKRAILDEFREKQKQTS
jgi:hypothetical protein